MALSTSYQELATSPNYSAVRVGMKYAYISGKTVRVYMGLYVNSSYSGGYGSDYCTAKIAGSTVRGDGSYSGGSYRVYGVKWTDIATKDITITSGGTGGSAATNVSWSIWSYHFQNTPSGTVTIPAGAVPASQYDAPSSLTLSATSVAIGGSVTLTASNSVYSGYSHTFNIYVGGTNRKTLTRSGTGSVTFSPDYATFAPLNTTGTSMTATVYLTTKRGSTQIGQVSKTLTITIPNNSTTKPTVSLSVTLDKQFKPDSSHTYNLSGITTATTKITATAKYSTTIKSYNTTFDGTSIGTSATISNKVLSASSAGNKTITGTATDGRGFANSASSTVNMTVYSRPRYATVVSKRCGFSKPMSSIIYTVEDPPYSDTTKIYIKTGGDRPIAYEYSSAWAEVQPTEKSDGEFLLPFTMTISSTAIESYNPITTTVRWKKKSDTDYGPEVSVAQGLWVDTGLAGLNPTGLDPNNSYDIQYIIQDQVGVSLSLSRSSIADIISTAFTLMDFAKFGKSMAIGKVSEAASLGETSVFEVGMPAYFHDMVYRYKNGVKQSLGPNTWHFTNPDITSVNDYIIVKLPAKYWLTSMFSFVVNFYGGYINCLMLINAYWYNNASDKIYNPQAVKIGGSANASGIKCEVRFGTIDADYLWISFKFSATTYSKGLCISNVVKAYANRQYLYEPDMFEIYKSSSLPNTAEHTITLTIT